jgi:hypothetical protein
LTVVRAGFAGKSRIWPKTIFRSAGRAGIDFRTTLHRPGMTNVPGPFLLIDFSISSESAWKNDWTSFLLKPVRSAMLAITCVFEGAFCDSLVLAILSSNGLFSVGVVGQIRNAVRVKIKLWRRQKTSG